MLIFKFKGVICSKGDVLAQTIDDILDMKKYDAVCVIDTDNLAHPQFLQ